ncbi:sugar phosphate isomerase [Bacteroidia bacterium]|nr:sugar phosphate isomerase [Bacteroidia bacterium]
MKKMRNVFLLSVAMLLVASCGCGNNCEKNIGLQMYSLRGSIHDATVGIDSVIAIIGKAGYKYVESASYDDGKIYGMPPEEFKAKIEAAGMTALSCHVGKNMEADMGPVWAWWDKCIATHKAAGMKYIVVPSMPTPDTLEGLQAYCDYFNGIGEKCAAAGLKFGYHNHAFEFEKVYDDGTVMYDYMVQNTNPANVVFELDVYWSQKGNRKAADLFKQYPGRFELLHVKDEKGLGRSGYMDFEELFNNIDSSTKYLIVEVEKYDLPEMESVKASLDYLNESAFVKADYSK